MVEINDGYGNVYPQLSKQEECLKLLGAAWNLFQDIDKKEKHACDADEFCKAIHAAQNILYTQLYIKKHGQV